MRAATYWDRNKISWLRLCLSICMNPEASDLSFPWPPENAKKHREKTEPVVKHVFSAQGPSYIFSKCDSSIYYLSLHFTLLSWLRKTPLKPLGIVRKPYKISPYSSQIVVSSMGFFQEGLALSSWRQNTIPTPSFFSLKPFHKFITPESSGFVDFCLGHPEKYSKFASNLSHGRWKVQKKTLQYVDYDRNFDMWHVQSWRSQERNILPSKDKGKSSSKVPLKGDMLVSCSIGFFQHPFNITPITTLWAHDVSTSPGVCKHEPTMIRSKHLA